MKILLKYSLCAAFAAIMLASAYAYMGNPRIVGPNAVISPDTAISCVHSDVMLTGQWKYELDLPPPTPGYETPPNTEETIPISSGNCTRWTWSVETSATGTGFNASSGGSVYTNKLANVNPVYFHSPVGGAYTIKLDAAVDTNLFPNTSNQVNILHVTLVNVDIATNTVVVAGGANNVPFPLTDARYGQVTWSLTPSVANGAEFASTSDNGAFVNAGTLGGSYVVKSVASDFTSCQSTATLIVVTNYMIVPSCRYIGLSNTITATSYTLDGNGTPVTTNSDWTIPDGDDKVRYVDGANLVTSMDDVDTVTIKGIAASSVANDVRIHGVASGNSALTNDAFLTVLKVDLDASKNLLSLKHDRDCNLEIKTTPATGITVDEYRIDIKRTNSASWYTLSTNKTMTPWHANIAGGFHLRGMAKIGGMECYSMNIVIVNQFPTYTQIEGDADIRSSTDTEWTYTLTDCTETPNQRRERGFWLRINTASNVYEHDAVVTGAWVGPDDGASLNFPNRPADMPADPAPNAIGAVYYVASFHTHTPTTYRTNSVGTRGVGPSDADNNANTAWDVPGIVYDYVESPAGSGSIQMGHPENAAAQRYLSLGKTKRSTP